ncbi:MAG: hypothetical protein WBV37_18505 [Nocardioidaceae bacterium]
MSGDQYVRLAAMLHERGVDVWFEIDLVAAWQQGDQAFQNAIDRMRVLAGVPGVVGFKVADELGYNDGISSVHEARSFLTDAARAIADVAPGDEMLVDMVVPELGCLPWRPGLAEQACAAKAVAAHPAASINAVQGYLEDGLVDRLDLSSGLLAAETYTGWGLDIQMAQQEAWSYVEKAGWAAHTVLQARKALAATGGYSGTEVDARADVGLFVDQPVQHGARAVDIWTWRQTYDGETVSLLADGSETNPLWQQLLERRRHGYSFITHMTPSSMAGSWVRSCDLAAQVFGQVFVAAGTG